MWHNAIRPIGVGALLWLFGQSMGPVLAVPPGYTLIWSEEFGQPVGSAPDAARWKYCLGNNDGWGNHELETYTDDLAQAHIVADPDAIDGKALQIEATEDGPGVYKSARIDTAGKLAFRYGYIETRIKLPAGNGLWPAFWMLGNDMGPAGWPGCGELDVMEGLGREPSVIHGSFHGPSASGDDYLTATDTLPDGKRFADGYHTFAVEWGPNKATLLVDGTPYETRTPADLRPNAQWVFNHPFFFILNLAVGGGDAGAPAPAAFPAIMRVDYIRVYQRSNPPVGQTITLKSRADSRYVSVSGSGALVANSAEASAPAQQFLVVDAGPTKVALKSVLTGMYVGVGEAGAVTTGYSAVGADETFQWVDTGDGGATLWSLASHKFITAPNYGKDPLAATASASDDWETFDVESLGK